MIIFLFILLPLGGLCEKVINNHEYFGANHQDCGLRSVNGSDQRTLHPWTVAVYTRQSSTSPWEYLVTGAVISPTVVVTIFPGGFGQPPPGGEPGQKYKLPSPTNVMVVGGLATTDLLEADSNAQYASVKYIAPCSNSKEPNDEDYHVVIIRLTKSFNVSTPYVRPICVPFFASYAFENFTVHTEQPGIMSGFYSPHGQGFDSKDGKNGTNYASIFAPATVYDEKRCENYAKYYKASARHLFCGTLLPGEIKNDTCLTYGTAGVWESTETVINYEPSFGPIPRFFLFAMLAVVPERDRGHCQASSPMISNSLRGAYFYINGHLRCPSTTFSCIYEGRCIELSSVCDGITDCGNGEDEDPTFCKATSECDLDNEYQCGLYGKCIEKNRTLDGAEDCPSGTDENPTLSIMASSMRKVIENQTQCEPLWIGEGIQVTCTDALGQPTNCTDAVPDTDITLTCAPSYSAAQRTTSVLRTCYEDGIWKPERSFRCEPRCGLWGESLQSKSSTANGKELEHAIRSPWHALIFRANETSVVFEYICAGSLIERNIILTAAHCTVDARGDPVDPQMFKIFINAPSANFSENIEHDGAQMLEVEQIIRPSSFDFTTLKSDIAIIHLARPALYNDYIRPICYPVDKYGRPPVANSTGKVPGFGLTENGELSVDLKFFELNVTKNDDCGLEASVDKFCAKDGGKNLCHGDKGAGIVFSAEDKQSGAYVLKGILSSPEYGPKGCAKGHSATSFTHVDSYTEWILSTIEGIDTNPYS